MKYFFMILFCALSFFSMELLAHKKKIPEQPSVVSPDRTKMIERINLSYLEKIKPIFREKCMDCHSQETRYPWYFRIPGIRQQIEDDIAEGKLHLDLTNDFPFGGHGSPEADLEEIADAVVEGTMPPLRYRLIHWDSGLTREEKETILQWATESRRLLR